MNARLCNLFFRFELRLLLLGGRTGFGLLGFDCGVSRREKQTG
jgi:hypothetical protein